MIRQILSTWVLLSGLAATLQAQQPTRYEYWFDCDFSQRQQGAMTGSQLTLQCEAGELPEGLHCLYFRVGDDASHWSGVSTRLFLHLAASPDQAVRIVRYQYWMDNDYAHATTVETPADQEMNIDIDPSWLGRSGVHTITFRAQDSLGRWSVTATRFFLAVPMSQGRNQIVAYKYWFNDAASSSTVVTLPEPASPYTLETAIQPNHLVKEGEVTDDNRTLLVDADGTQRVAAWNKLYVTFLDTEGQWSQPLVSTFAAPPAKDYDPEAVLSSIALQSVDDEAAWCNPGAPVSLQVTGHYAHPDSQAAHIFYSVDDQPAIRIGTPFAANEDFTARIECVFRASQPVHSLKFFAEDLSEMASDTVLIEIPDMMRCQLDDLPAAMTYTGQPLEPDGITVYDYGQLLTPGQHYTLSYYDNIDEGDARVHARGRFPYYMGKSSDYYFRIHSVIDADEVALLQRMQDETGYSRWDLSGPVYSDALDGITARNRHVTRIATYQREMTGQMPNYLFALPQLQSLDLSSQHLQGEIDHSLIGQQLTELDLSDNQLTGLTGVLPATIERLDLRGQQLAGPYSLHARQLADGSFRESLPNILFYNHQQQDFNPGYRDFRLAMEDEVQGEYFDLEYIQDELRLWFSQDLTFASGTAFMWYDYQQNHQLTCLFGYDPGDANLDGEINVLDLSALVPRAMGGNAPKIHLAAADLWPDQALNVQDVVGMVNLLLAHDPAYRSPVQRVLPQGDDMPSAVPARLSLADGQLCLHTDVGVSAFDIVIDGVADAARFLPDASLRQLNVSTRQEDGRLHLVAYVHPSQSLAEGSHVLGQVEGATAQSQITYALMADPKAQAIRVEVGQHTGIGTTAADVSAGWYLYTLNGVLVGQGRTAEALDDAAGTLRGGLYLLVTHNAQGGVQTQKVRIKQ